MKVITNEMITDKKSSNLLIAVYEGFLKEGTNPTDDTVTPVFGRSIYCNHYNSYYIGNTHANERHGNGCYVQKGKILEEGFF